MSQAPKNNVTNLKNEAGLVLMHPDFGRLSGRRQIENVSLEMFRRLRQLGVDGRNFGDILFYKPHWLKGLTVHDGLAYDGGPKVIMQWIEDLAGRFATETPEQVGHLNSNGAKPVNTVDVADKKTAQPNNSLRRERKWFTPAPVLEFTAQKKSPALQTVSPVLMSQEQMNEAIDDLLPTL